MNPPLPRRLIRSLAALATEVAVRLEDSLAAGSKRLEIARSSLQAALGREIAAAECADMLSQAMVASLPLVLARKEVYEVAAPWLLEAAQPWERLVLEEVLAASSISPGKVGSQWLMFPDADQVLSTEYSVLSTPHLFEHFLAEHRRLHRKRGGVFYTPPELVQFTCRRVHQQLQEEFRRPGGLAEATILDPGAGTGAFLLGSIDLIHAEFSPAEGWDQYVAQHLLPHLVGIEIIPAACLAAQLNIAAKLADKGFDFQLPGKIRVELGNTLADGDLTLPANLQSAICNLKSPLVLLGNPPFSSLSDNRGQWITELVRGSKERPGYVVTADERLGERKTWLHDDYVKFIRYAQWLIEQAGSGIVGFVTNHGYLDNVTFRLMRRELMRVFSRIDVVDLHGNRKKGESSPDCERDENVFGLDQGIAIGFFRRLPKQGDESTCELRHGELWGTREEKINRLSAPKCAIASTIITPNAPNFLFTPAPPPMPPEYASAWRLPDAMPVNTTAPVTARDHFVVAHTREELCRRLAEFRDLAIPDDEIRRRYFTRTRSAKYAPGDTRSWKLTAARRIIAAEDNWQSFIRRCLYRPYDWRFVFWHKAMIDWPRTAVTNRLQIEDCRLQIDERLHSAICNPQSAILLSRRQMLPTQPCSFFWMADRLPLDGVIRSDNRGSESLFPLYLNEPNSEAADPQANFALDFLAAASHQLQFAWLPVGRGDLSCTLGPEDLLDYIYALFHSPTYRERYAAELRTDFPRILLPASKNLFQDLVPRGQRLTAWHTLRAPAPAMNGVTADQLQQFRAGGHQLLRPSPVTSAAPHDHPLAPYIAATLEEMSAIDEAIQLSGGFPAAFTP
ncbi:MAG: type ISP restriction/modification enzyme [Pirellulaceae bacterium]